MQRRWTSAIASVVLAIAGLSSTPAGAGPPGTWTKLNNLEISNTSEFGLARTGDGVLHVIWVEDDGTNWNLVHRSIQPDGIVSPVNPVVSGYGFMNPVPDLLVAGDGTLRAFFGGSPPGGIGGLWTTSSSDSGQTWSAPALVNSRTFWGGDVSALQLGNGSFWQQTGTLLHPTLDEASPDVDLEPQWGGCCVYGARLGADSATGDMWTAVYATEGSPDPPVVDGAYAQQLDPVTGAPVGAAIQMPGSSVDYAGQPSSSNPLRRMPLAARVGGGMYMAFNAGYPTVADVLVWRVGDPGSYVIANYTEGLGDSAVAMTAAPDGRMWVLWGTETVPAKVYASISNDTVTAWSPPAQLRVFSGSDYGDIFGIQANASADRIDVFLNTATVNEAALFHTQLAVPPEWTSGADVIRGSADADYIYGGGGDDKLSAGGGRDQVYGGGGDDKLDGGAGKDILNGGKGKDVCVVTAGDKTKGCERVVQKRHR